MWFDLVLFTLALVLGAWGVRERNERIGANVELHKERRLSETLGMLNGQLRSRLEEAQARLVEVGGMGSPAPRSERRVRREA